MKYCIIVYFLPGSGTSDSPLGRVSSEVIDSDIKGHQRSKSMGDKRQSASAANVAKHRKFTVSCMVHYTFCFFSLCNSVGEIKDLSVR